MATTTKKCPMCAEEIPLAAVTCEYCGAQFEVTSTGYCQTCHEVRNADENGECKVCGNAVVDLRVESKFIEEPLQKPMLAIPSFAPPEPPKTSRRILPYGILGGILIIIIGGALLWLGWKSLTAAPSFFDASTPAALPLTPDLIPTVAPTRTPPQTPTATPVPAWITEFAEPVLAAIANQPPNFQDDFSQESVSWRFYDEDNGWMEITDGALVTTIGTGGDPNSAHFCAVHPAMRFKNFALRVDVDLSKMSSQDGPLIKWRENDISDGLGFIFEGSRWWVYASKPYAELAVGQQNINPDRELTITILSKDTQYAGYVGETLFFYVDDSGRRPGVGIKLCVSDRIGAPTVVKYDDIRVWDLDKIQGLP